MAERLRSRPTAHWLQLLQQAQIPCGPVNTFDQALADPQVRARDMVVNVPLPDGSTLPMPGNPVKLSAAQDAPWTGPPTLGQHTDAVLTGLMGYDAERVAALRAQGVVA